MADAAAALEGVNATPSKGKSKAPAEPVEEEEDSSDEEEEEAEEDEDMEEDVSRFSIISLAVLVLTLCHALIELGRD